MLNKFLTFPYPYSNGRLHIGHGYTMSKVDFMARWYKQFNSNEVLFPLGFHCTGMPIQAMAQRISRGDTKAIDIMKKSGIANDEIDNFKDPIYWTHYFPEKAIEDSKKFQLDIDFRRSFITVDNPYYSSFVTWQFNKLLSMGLIEKIARNAIYCLEDGQPCADHDRSEGEGVEPITIQYDLKHLSENRYLVVKSKFATNTVEVSSETQFVEIKFNDEINIVMSKELSQNAIEHDISVDVKEAIITESDTLKIVKPHNWAYDDYIAGTRNIGDSASASNSELIHIPVNITVPASRVISRTGFKCVVKKTEQWYIMYGNESWKKRVMDFIKTKLKTNNDIVRNKLIIAAEWLKEWCCSREFGLGTKIPWDTRYLIDSLSDSTIYMSYYTVCHMLHHDLYGKEPNLITPDQLCDDFWDSIFIGNTTGAGAGLGAGAGSETGSGSGSGTSSKVPSDTIATLRSEFLKWYPVDMRISGKDLIPNHLIMCIYNHIAIFGEDMCPKGFSCNGYITINKKKVSKSTGNFITVSELVDKYGVDVSRVVLAQSGDGTHDADFNVRDIQSVTKKLRKVRNLLETISTSYQSVARNELACKRFIQKIIVSFRDGSEYYESMQFKEVIRTGLYDMLNAYNEATKDGGLSCESIELYQYVQCFLLAPIVPWVKEFLDKLDRPVMLDNYPIDREFFKFQLELINKIKKLIRKSAATEAKITLSSSNRALSINEFTFIQSLSGLTYCDISYSSSIRSYKFAIEL